MITEITGDTLFVELLMLRQADPRLVIVFEGYEDVGIVDPHVDAGVCETVPAHGKKNALRLAEIVNAQGTQGVLIVIDRDFDDDQSIGLYPGPVVASENYDLMVDLLTRCPDLLRGILANFGDRNAVRSHLTGVGETAIQVLVRYAAPLGLIRRVSVSRRLQLKLDRFPVYTFLDIRAEDMLESIVDMAIVRSPDAQVDKQELLELLHAEYASEPAPAKACNSHDLVSVLAHLLRTLWGRCACSTDNLARTIRSAVTMDCLRRTQLFSDVDAFGHRNGAQIWAAA